MRLAASLLLLAAIAAPARADTLGYLPCTAAGATFTLARARGAPRTLVARTAPAWREAWRALGGTGPAPAVDFERDLVVGVVNGPADDRVVYRVQLDDGSEPRALEVHLGHGDAPCGGQARTPPPARVHLVAVPRSALPVRFLADEMLDGGLFEAANEGVESTQVAFAAAAARPSTGAKAPLREDAERAVIATLPAADLKKLGRGPLDGRMRRVPHGWTRLAVTRAGGRWTVRYDHLTFEVDVSSGAVTRR